MRKLTALGFITLLLLMTSFAAAQDDQEIDLTPPTLGDFDPASIEGINIEEYPVLPELTDHAREIYEAGQEAGRNPGVFSKIGDCMTASAFFMAPFGLDEYDLGEYEDLQAVVDYFGETPARDDPEWEVDSFANPGLATASGFNTASALDAIWADPAWCGGDESPLTCEYRVSNPAFSLIMFGTNDVYFLEADAFDFYLRTIILQTINTQIVPVLYTFPTRPEYPEKTLVFNQIIIKIAKDYDLPLINLWVALQDLPNDGVDEVEPIHLSIPEDERTGVFDEEHLEFGYTIRNLVTLQAMQVLLEDLES